ncbi:MAG TPA: bifunctional DNA-formamidopyrimidine glycosylase/DNA-(apurinic or apyrimidinic site) lyase [Burkholderiaceae bacterium]|nr:bifunctional DNA-formamidopyrimidine glycosylase/DNA-(apurinic or apyrimidinic site) lyase [Burkholderiaceae bacterium]
MPELPEVEVTRRSFADALQGATVQALRLGKPLRWPLGCAPERLLGQRAGLASRRGKYLWLPIGGEGLLLHLGMSGSLAFGRDLGPSGPHDHFELQTDRGLLRLHDPRRFGAVVWSPAIDEPPVSRLLAGLGLEPFDERFTGAYLHEGLKGRRVAVKQALLAGDIVVGAGNIYACEALFLAGIHPASPAGRLSRPRAERLAASVRQVLAQALEAGGTTLRDFRDAHGVAGSFQMQAQVYGREGEDCRRCGTPVRRIVQGQRSTFFCPRCQTRS